MLWDLLLQPDSKENAMRNTERILKDTRAALERDSRIDLHHNPIGLGLRDDKITLAGEVDNVAVKKLVMENAAAFAGEGGIDDHLLVKPGEVMEDADLCELVFDALHGDSAFNDITLHARAGGIDKGYRETPRAPTGAIEVLVEGGVVTLSGEVESYAHKALAGVLSWWRRGTRDVVNNLSVEHAMDDPDGEMTDALRMVLEKDRLVQAAQIMVRCRDFTAILDGMVKNVTEKSLAEADAWYLFGVTDVDNRLKVLA
jgi:osmotically-inducible protein OsmY